MENNWFKNPGDLELSNNQKKAKTEDKYFRPAGDLDDKNNKPNIMQNKEQVLKNPEEIKEWLKTIVSGEKKSYQAFKEGLMVTGAARMFVSLDKLIEMIEKGDNIISAEYFENMKMILIEFESFSLSNTSKSR